MLRFGKIGSQHSKLGGSVLAELRLIDQSIERIEYFCEKALICILPIPPADRDIGLFKTRYVCCVVEMPDLNRDWM